MKLSTYAFDRAGIMAFLAVSLVVAAGAEVTQAQAEDVKARIARDVEVNPAKDTRQIFEDALNPHFSATYRNAAIDAGNHIMDAGTIKFYDGTQPTDCSVAVSTQNVLISLALGGTAFGASSSGSASASGLPLSGAISASGTCTWFRCFTSGAAAVHDGSVGTASANAIVPTTTFTATVTLSISSFAISHAA